MAGRPDQYQYGAEGEGFQKAPSLAFPLSDKGVSRSKPKAIANPELARAHPNRPQKAIGKRSEAAYFLGRSLLLTPSTSPRDRDYGLTFGEELRGTPPPSRSSGPEVVAELAAEFRSEQDYLGECNKNRLLAAVAHAAIRRRSAQGIRAWMSRSGDSIQRRNWWWNKLEFLFDLLRYKRSAPKQAPLYRMNKERPIDDRATLILLLTLPPCHLKGEVAEASLKARPKSDL
ncbi:hypothetical protein ACOSQ2_003189 [Xanthoceras sorbifolium]